MLIYLLILLYVIPLMVNYLCVKWDYTHYYKWIKPDAGDFLFVVLPCINLIAMFAYIIDFINHHDEVRAGRENKRTIMERFFGIKK